MRKLKRLAMFGFTVYSSIEQASSSGLIPYPSFRDRVKGGHAVMAVGYDDRMKIKNRFGDKETMDALFIRNSWGRSWGKEGHGWLPYEYIMRGWPRTSGRFSRRNGSTQDSSEYKIAVKYKKIYDFPS